MSPAGSFLRSNELDRADRDTDQLVLRNGSALVAVDPDAHDEPAIVGATQQVGQVQDARLRAALEADVWKRLLIDREAGILREHVEEWCGFRVLGARP